MLYIACMTASVCHIAVRKTRYVLLRYGLSFMPDSAVASSRLLYPLLLMRCVSAIKPSATDSPWCPCAVMSVVRGARDAAARPKQYAEYREVLRLLRLMVSGANGLMLFYAALLLYATFSAIGRGTPEVFFSILHGVLPGLWIGYNMQVRLCCTAAAVVVLSGEGIARHCSASL